MKITVNPDEEFAAKLKRAIKENGGYCPCSLVKTEDTKCMCMEFRQMESGVCHCGLYVKNP